MFTEGRLERNVGMVFEHCHLGKIVFYKVLGSPSLTTL